MVAEPSSDRNPLQLLFSSARSWVSGLVLFPAPKPSYNEDLPDLQFISPGGSQASWLDLPTDDYRIPVLWLENDNAKATVLYFHGNACDIGQMDAYWRVLASRAGVNVLMMEFPGYGVDKGKSTPEKIDKWARVCVNWLLARGHGVGSVVLYGRSIGSGPAAKLAAWIRRKGPETDNLVAGLILESAFSSLRKLASDRTAGLLGGAVPDVWATDENLKTVAGKVPVLLLHGTNDDVIPVEHTKYLKACTSEITTGAPVQMELFDGRGHNNMTVSRQVLAFLNDIGR